MHSYEPVIPKDALIDGAYYKGRCRNAEIARWNGQEQIFYHWRTKWGSRFIEKIHCPEDESHYDVFVAEAQITMPEEEIPFE